MMKLPITILTVFVAATFAVDAAEVANLDFARQRDGLVPDKTATKQPALADTWTVYGRLRSSSAMPERGKLYAVPAMGRNGDLDAMRLGDAGLPLRLAGRVFQTGKPFAVEAWVWLYGGRKPGEVIRHYGGTLLSGGANSYNHGFSVNTDSRWSPHGWLGLHWYNDHIPFCEFSPGKWHQLVVSHSGKAIALYVDGELVGKKDAAIDFSNSGDIPGGELMVGSKAQLDFKIDQLTAYDDQLSAATIKEHYLKGIPPQELPAVREERLTGLKLKIPHDSYGYFQVGQKIPVLASSDSEANELLIDGVRHPLPFELRFAEPGLREVELALADHGKILRRKTYPLAIFPFAVKSSKLGALELVSQRPELTALGVRLSRVVVSWQELEPKKREYDWARLDSVLARNRELGVETILCLTGVPAWAKLPQDMAAYTKLWRLLANRYDDARLFEVWNSNNPNENIGRESYLPLLQAAAETLRQEIPDAKILAGRIDISDGLANAAWLQQEASDWYDIFSARKYSVEPANSVWAAAATRATEKPVWNTACGIQQAAQGEPPRKTSPIPTVDEETAAIWLVQDLALQFADGVKRVVLDAGPSNYVPADCAREGLPGKEGLALAVFNGLVGKDAKLGRLSDVPPGVVAVRFENPSGLKGLILFSTGGTVELKVAGARCLDLYGKTAAPVVTGRPIYLLDVVALSERKSK